MEYFFSKWLNTNGLTQEEAALKLGVCQTTVHNWRSGKTKPSLKHLSIIAKVCGVDIGRLLPDDMKIEISAPSIQEDSLHINALDLYKQLFELKDGLLKSRDEMIVVLQQEIVVLKAKLTQLENK